MMDAIAEVWRQIGPLSAESQRLMVSIKEARESGQKETEMALWVEFYKSLNPVQQSGMMSLMAIVQLADKEVGNEQAEGQSPTD